MAEDGDEDEEGDEPPPGPPPEIERLVSYVPPPTVEPIVVAGAKNVRFGPERWELMVVAAHRARRVQMMSQRRRRQKSRPIQARNQQRPRSIAKSATSPLPLQQCALRHCTLSLPDDSCSQSTEKSTSPKAAGGFTPMQVETLDEWGEPVTPSAAAALDPDEERRRKFRQSISEPGRRLGSPTSPPSGGSPSAGPTHARSETTCARCALAHELSDVRLCVAVKTVGLLDSMSRAAVADSDSEDEVTVVQVAKGGAPAAAAASSSPVSAGGPAGAGADKAAPSPAKSVRASISTSSNSMEKRFEINKFNRFGIGQKRYILVDLQVWATNACLH